MIIPPYEAEVRFADLDLLGHVNNAVYLSYFEMTRVHYFSYLLGKNWDYRQEGFILVRNEIDYLKPIFLYDQPKITLHVLTFGVKSITFEYLIQVNSEIVTKGKSVLVAFNVAENKSIPLSEKLITAFSTLKKNEL